MSILTIACLTKGIKIKNIEQKQMKITRITIHKARMTVSIQNKGNK